MLKINLNYYIYSIIIIYIPFHLFEEALENFPKWMYTHKWIPEQITYSHWMANNIFFYLFVLQIGFIASIIFPTLSFLGIGILFWGIINLLDHLIYTLIDHKKSPGIYTGFIYAIIASIAFYKIYTDGIMNIQLLLTSLTMGIIYAFLPVLLSMRFHKFFKGVFV